MDTLRETKQQFIERYLESMGGKRNFVDHLIALPCDCIDGGGPTHWAAVARDPLSVHSHLDLYAPKGTPWPDDVPKYTGK